MGGWWVVGTMALVSLGTGIWACWGLLRRPPRGIEYRERESE